MEESDARMLGDDRGPNADPDEKIASHLAGDEEDVALGDPNKDVMREDRYLKRELRRYFLQEDPAAAGAVDPREPHGSYAPFDMVRDHTGTSDVSATWYRSPGRDVGTSGDPYRSEDPAAQLGMHPKSNDPVASPPASHGEEGTDARRTPGIWQLSAGSDTSKVLGANAKPDTGGEESTDDGEGDTESGTEEAPEGEEPEGKEAEGEQQDSPDPDGGRDR